MNPPGLWVVSLGGNALLRRGERGTVEEQLANVRACMAGVAHLLARGHRVVITHGNGPVVGNLVLQNEAVRNTVPPMPLYICDADSEGGIGFLVQQTLYNHLRRLRPPPPVVALITQVVVDPDDPAFDRPTKPIGPYYSPDEAAELERERGWRIADDAGRGYRRVVPSPRPLRVVEADVVGHLAAAGVVVIAAGGGGVPVVEDAEGNLRGADAVVDKDRTTAVLGLQLGAEAVLTLTSVDRAYRDFGSPDPRGIDEIDAPAMRRHLAAGHFAPGSMGPKVEAALEFVEGGGRLAIITSPELATAALEGRAGTRIRGPGSRR